MTPTTHSYIAHDSRNRFVDACIDDPRHALEVTAKVAEWRARGLIVERVLNEVVSRELVGEMVEGVGK